MKILVSGCSISAGDGFSERIHDPAIYPNKLAEAYGANLVNVSVPGYDNQGIFLNTLEEMLTDNYDLILIQFTSLNRLVVSPNVNTRMCISNAPSLPQLENREFHNFYRVLTTINKDFEHLIRLFKIIIILQNLSKEQGYNIKFINGLLHWDEEFFNLYRSKFAYDIIDFHQLPDHKIIQALDIIDSYKKKIDLSMWINPYISLE